MYQDWRRNGLNNKGNAGDCKYSYNKFTTNSKLIVQLLMWNLAPTFIDNNNNINNNNMIITKYIYIDQCHNRNE